jgi:hypothetical protein
MIQDTQPSRRGDAPLGVGATVVEVAHQQVRTAAIAEFADLSQQPRDRHVRLGAQPAAQMIAVGQGGSNVAVTGRPKMTGTSV